MTLRTVERVLHVSEATDFDADKKWSDYFCAPVQVLYDMEDKPKWTMVS